MIDSDAPPSPTAVAEPDPFAAGQASVTVIRGGSLRVIATVIGVASGAITAPLVVRHLGITAFGRYVTVTSVIYVVTALTEGGLANVAVRTYSTGDAEQRRSLVANLLGLRLALAAIGSAVAIGFGVVAGYSHALIVGLGLGALGYVIAAIQGALSVPLAGGMRLTALAAIDLLRALATALLLVGLVVAGSGLTGFYTVNALVWTLALGLTVVLVRRAAPLRPALDRARWRALLKETAVYAVAAALGTVYFQVAQVSMSIIDPGPQTGYYAIAFRIIDLANGIPWLLAASVLPVLSVAAGDPQRLRYIAARVFEGASIAGGWVAIVVIVGARLGIDIIAGAKGHPSVSVLRIAAIGVTATFLVSSWGFVLLALRMHRQLMIANAATFALAIVSSALLIPPLGARGGAATTALLEVTLAGLYIALLSRHGIQPPTRFVVRFLAAAILGLAVGAALLRVNAIVAVIGASTAYLVTLHRLRAIPSELIDAVPRLRR